MSFHSSLACVRVRCYVYNHADSRLMLDGVVHLKVLLLSGLVRTHLTMAAT